MKRFFDFIAAAAIMAVLPLAAAGQSSQADEEARALTDRFLAGLSGLDEGLLGVSWLGVYLSDTQNIGKVKIEVVKSPEGSGGTYLVKMDMNLQMGPRSFYQKREAVLDEKLSLVSSKSEDDLPGGRKSSTVRKDGGNWVYDVRWQKKGAEEESSMTLKKAIDGPDYKELLSGILVMRKLDLSAPATYAFPGVCWPKIEKGEDQAPITVDIFIRISVKKDHKHRGKAVKALSVLVEDPSDEEKTSIVIDEKGLVLDLRSDEAPVSMIAGTEEECGKDIEAPKPTVKGEPAKTPIEAVVTYFRVLAGEKDPDVLDAVMDWIAVRDVIAENNEEVAAMNPEVFGNILKAQFRKSAGAISPEQLAAIESMLEAQEDGDSATVAMIGAENPFKLRKTGQSWKITYFPH